MNFQNLLKHPGRPESCFIPSICRFLCEAVPIFCLTAIPSSPKVPAINVVMWMIPGLPKMRIVSVNGGLQHSLVE